MGSWLGGETGAWEEFPAPSSRLLLKQGGEGAGFYRKNLPGLRGRWGSRGGLGESTRQAANRNNAHTCWARSGGSPRAPRSELTGAQAQKWLQGSPLISWAGSRVSESRG